MHYIDDFVDLDRSNYEVNGIKHVYLIVTKM